jgi:hypothetical protein
MPEIRHIAPFSPNSGRIPLNPGHPRRPRRYRPRHHRTIALAFPSLSLSPLLVAVIVTLGS